MATKKAKRMYKNCPARGFVYVWEGPIRITHWVNVASIIILVMSGLYIHYPFVKHNPVDHPYMMGSIRYTHYLTAMIFTTSIIVRGMWAFLGNKYAHIRTFYNPFNKDDRKYIISYLKYYCFLEKKPKHVLTHNPMAQYAYIGIFLVFMFQIFSGFALWSQINPDGTAYAIFGSIFSLMSNQWVRYLHYFSIFVIAIFLMAHLYAAVLVDFRTHAGDISSIFSGWKADIED
ncbi:Ni/Fe-hydrogenase, b-type cytochrome subunit [Denitrovibrio acetiphilus DSM 12809]|uniref:Ni/Fe-hydrogenase, b-type cytochrome subunit n=1 Tax=Denitrovibrio acetiphilus (strain DSM 12809 / NBRC 114555 / N2460) TaxID=522772 RepID=D4H7I5_DENA2|nr:Ni/Fe-hydrogenase, b-type cytochrome subunit [Denitrovibrio acetiphilus]ADD67984.1 Ni/Fe-hydrogenase, b-type cytochrome subunit [Denitrovibrio acetiphilus DSM 12809]